MDIVAIDDDRDSLALLEFLLRGHAGQTITTFDQSVDALDWCARNEPDLVIIDYMMPVMDGVEFIKRFRSLDGRQETPVLMLTADTHTYVRHRALEAGATDFLVKPVDKVELCARVRNMLALRQKQNWLTERTKWLAGEVKQATAQILLRERETIFRLSKAAEYRDPTTGRHILRMAHYSALIARRLGLPEFDQNLILDAAPMHDVGKVGIPDAILLKPGELDAHERAIMEEHTSIGYEILRDSTSRTLQAAAEIALTHHERYDGLGYPRGLQGQSIPVFGRIVAIADVFDALASQRPYKHAWEAETAGNLIRQEAGARFDPECVEAFLASWDHVHEIRVQFCEGQ